MASGISNTCRMGGVATGIAALGAIFQHRITTTLAEGSHHPAAGLAGTVAAGGSRAAVQSAPPASRAEVLDVTRHAFLVGLNDILLVGAGIVLVGAIAAACLIRTRDFHLAQQPLVRS
jgi:hypothetical protein